MAEPQLIFYNANNPGEFPNLSELSFTSASGAAIKAGEESATNTIQVWNAPYSSRTGVVAVPPRGSYYSTADDISGALDLDVTVRDASGGTTGEVTLGRWTDVAAVANAPISGNGDVFGGNSMRIGYSGSTSYAAKLGNLPVDNGLGLRFKLVVPGNASPGEKTFVIRFSYSFV